MKLIIAATDGSEGAERAVAFAAGLAKAMNAKLLLVHVSKDGFSNEEMLVLERLRVTEGDALEQISLGILSKAEAVAHRHGATNIEVMSNVATRTSLDCHFFKSDSSSAFVTSGRTPCTKCSW
ncbi:MAG: universal stress protein [Rhodomicrobium sp.]